MPGTTPIQGQSAVDSSSVNIECVENFDSEFETNSDEKSLSSACSSMTPPSPPKKKARWSPIKREVSNCDSEPSNPNLLHSDAAVRAYSSVTNLPNQIWVSGPPTPPTGNITPNTAAINLLQYLAEGRVIVEGNQIPHVKGTNNPISATIHAPPKDPQISKEEILISKTNKTDDQNDCKIIDDDQDKCKIVHVEEGDESIKEMLAKQINYENKLKYTDGQVSRTENAKKLDPEVKKKRQIQELVKRGV